MKRKAHREAWYGNSNNPFRRTRSNTSTYQSNAHARDLEAQDNRPPNRVSTEPIPARAGRLNSIPDEGLLPTTTSGNSEKDDLEGATMTGASSNRKEQSSEETAVETPVQDTEKHGLRKLAARFRGSKTKTDEIQRSNTTASETSGNKTLKHKKFTFANQLQATLFNSWINVLLVAAPVGIALYYVPNINPLITFLVNFVAIVPLAALLSYATEEIALRVGEVLGGLLNATFGYGFPYINFLRHY